MPVAMRVDFLAHADKTAQRVANHRSRGDFFKELDRLPMGRRHRTRLADIRQTACGHIQISPSLT
jgi:hypothetical protein